MMFSLMVSTMYFTSSSLTYGPAGKHIPTLNKASDTVSKNFDKVCQEIQNDNTPEPSDEKDGNVQSKMTSIGTLVQTALGASVNAARDRAQDYLKVLQAFAPKPGANKPANNANNNQNQESNDNNQNSNEEGEK